MQYQTNRITFEFSAALFVNLHCFFRPEITISLSTPLFLAAGVKLQVMTVLKNVSPEVILTLNAKRELLSFVSGFTFLCVSFGRCVQCILIS